MTEKELGQITYTLKEVRAVGALITDRNQFSFGTTLGTATIPHKVFELALVTYRNKLSAELRSLGYEGNEAKDIPAPDCYTVSAPDENTVHVPGAKFPLAWDKKYYVPSRIEKKEYVTCGICGGDGSAVVDRADGGGEYKCVCPACHGGGKISVVKEIAWAVWEYNMCSVTRDSAIYTVRFQNVAYGTYLDVFNYDLPGMAVSDGRRKRYGAFYQTREEAQAEADRLNAERGAAKDVK